MCLPRIPDADEPLKEAVKPNVHTGQLCYEAGNTLSGDIKSEGGHKDDLGAQGAIPRQRSTGQSPTGFVFF